MVVGGGVADAVVQQLQFIACLTEWEGADWKARVKLVLTTHDVIKYFLKLKIFISSLLLCPRLVIISHNYFPQPATCSVLLHK